MKWDVFAGLFWSESSSSGWFRAWPGTEWGWWGGGMLCSKREGMLGEGTPCTHVSAGLPPMTWPPETGCKPRAAQKQFPPMAVSEESQDWQRYLCGDTITVFSVPENILSSWFTLFRNFFFKKNIERSNSVRCSCSWDNPTLQLQLREGLVGAVLSLSVLLLIHPCGRIIHSRNRAILEQTMLSGHIFNPMRSCEDVIPRHVLVNLAAQELEPGHSYRPDKPRGCSHTLCCSSKPKPQNF